jgi:RNA polymerase sporulation-specific sigma factor
MLELLNALQNFLFFVLHVNQSGNFPKALSAAKERECFERMKSGDAESKKLLVEHNLRLVVHIAKKYFSPEVEQDDLISIGTIGLIKAVSSFDCDKGTRFATYAARCIDNEILMYFRNKKKTANDISISEPIDSDRDGNTLTLIDVISCEDNIADNIDLAMKIDKLRGFMSALSDRERVIINLRYGLSGREPLTQREVAQRLKISRSYVSRIEKKALGELRDKFDKDDTL